MEPVFPMPDPTPQQEPVGGDVARLLELMAEGQERRAHLLNIQNEVAALKAKTVAYVNELQAAHNRTRDQLAAEVHRANTAETRLCLMHEALRKLHQVVGLVGMNNVPDRFVSAVTVAMSEAAELLTACEPYLK